MQHFLATALELDARGIEIEGLTAQWPFDTQQERDEFQEHVRRREAHQPPTRWATAIHEAAHAVLAWLLYWKIVHVSAVENSERLGNCLVKFPPGITWNRATLTDYCAQRLAGPVAMREFLGAQDRDSCGDRQNCHKVLLHEFPDDIDTHRGIYDTGRDIATEEVRKHQVAILSLAGVLMEAGEVCGEDAVSIIEAAEQRVEAIERNRNGQATVSRI